LETFGVSMGRKWAEQEFGPLDLIGGRREDRTRDLRIANAALSQLS
jgi:hypothetical protein